jgi:hypothetical protein
MKFADEAVWRMISQHRETEAAQESGKWSSN